MQPAQQCEGQFQVALFISVHIYPLPMEVFTAQPCEIYNIQGEISFRKPNIDISWVYTVGLSNFNAYVIS